MLYLFSGTDHYRIQERVHSLEQDFLTHTKDGKKLVFDIEEAWGEGERSLLVSALSPGLFATPYYIVLRGIEGLEEKSGAWLTEALRTHDASMTVVLVAKQAGRKKLPQWLSELKQILPNLQTETFASMAPLERAQALETKLQSLGVAMEPRAKALLLQAFPENTGRLLQEATRLALSAESSKITVAQVEGSVTPSLESVTFAALDALVQGNKARAIALFRQEETEPDAPFALLGLCSWQVRRLIAIKELSEAGKNAGDIARELKTSPYPIQKTLPLVARFSFERLRRALGLLADLDQALKTGRMQPGIALDLFVWKF